MEIVMYLGLALGLFGGFMAAGKSDFGVPFMVLGFTIASWAWIVGSVRRHLALMEQQTVLLKDIKASLDRAVPPPASNPAPQTSIEERE